MKKAFILIPLLAVCTGVFVLAQASRISIENMPPVVIKTTPHSGSMNVDPNLKELRVTFSKRMQTKKMWSWVQISKGTFPKVTGQPYFLKDGKTCVLPVKLQPGKTYATWINQGKFNSFRDLKGNPAIPYLLIFKTKR